MPDANVEAIELILFVMILLFGMTAGRVIPAATRAVRKQIVARSPVPLATKRADYAKIARLERALDIKNEKGDLVHPPAPQGTPTAITESVIRDGAGRIIATAVEHHAPVPSGTPDGTIVNVVSFVCPCGERGYSERADTRWEAKRRKSPVYQCPVTGAWHVGFPPDGGPVNRMSEKYEGPHAEKLKHDADVAEAEARWFAHARMLGNGRTCECDPPDHDADGNMIVRDPDSGLILGVLDHDTHRRVR